MIVTRYAIACQLGGHYLRSVTLAAEDRWQLAGVYSLRCRVCGSRLSFEAEGDFSIGGKLEAEEFAAQETAKNQCRKCGTQIGERNRAGLCRRHWSRERYRTNQAARAKQLSYQALWRERQKAEAKG